MIKSSRVATSAREAQKLGFLRPSDTIAVNRRFHLTEAKELALHALASDTAGISHEPPPIMALGRDGLARLRVEIHLERESGHAAEYDIVVAGELAYVLCGGDLVRPTLVPESYLLDLERESFLRLLGDPRTQSRIEHMLSTGQPLRN